MVFMRALSGPDVVNRASTILADVSALRASILTPSASPARSACVERIHERGGC